MTNIHYVPIEIIKNKVKIIKQTNKKKSIAYLIQFLRLWFEPAHV